VEVKGLEGEFILPPTITCSFGFGGCVLVSLVGVLFLIRVHFLVQVGGREVTTQHLLGESELELEFGQRVDGDQFLVGGLVVVDLDLDVSRHDQVQPFQDVHLELQVHFEYFGALVRHGPHVFCNRVACSV